MLDALELVPAVSLPCGAFEGWSGVVYTLAHLGRLWQSEDLLGKAGDIAVRHGAGLRSGAEAAVSSDDLIGGLAGCIGALGPVYVHGRQDAVLEILSSCGRLLVSRAVPMSAGVGWPSPHATSPLPGFAHGNAGIAWALMRLHGITGEEDLRQTALEALRYEATLFDEGSGNWLPFEALSQKTGPSPLGVAWCHGAPGIALGRLPFPDAGGEVEVAVATTLRDGFGANHSLCHGDLGNLDCLVEVARTRSDPALLDELGRLATQIAIRGRDHRWLCGIPRHSETPGLMVGLAGIGYGLLRLARPEFVPSVLALAEPRA